MQTLESLRGKIETATDMRSVVKTMKTLAAVSIRQYERAVEALAEYNRTVELGFQIVLRDTAFRQQVMASDVSDRQSASAAIVFGTDQGMCGQFNERIAAELATSNAAPLRPALLAIGHRVESHLIELGLRPRKTFSVPASVSEITALVQDLLLAVDQLRENEQIRRLDVYFNRRTRGASITPTRLPILPIGAERYRRYCRQGWDSRSLPMFTMDRRTLLSCVIRQYLFVSLYRACAESLSSENASRIAAMQVAEKSIEDRLDELGKQFNQIRQTAITEELLDVVSGFEALSKQRLS